MERAEPKLFNEYFVSNNIFIFSDFLKLRTPGSEWIFIILFLSAFISDAKRDTLLAYHMDESRTSQKRQSKRESRETANFEMRNGTPRDGKSMDE